MSEKCEKKSEPNISVAGIDININGWTVRLSLCEARQLRDRLNEMLAPTPCKADQYKPNWWAPWHESAFTTGLKK